MVKLPILTVIEYPVSGYNSDAEILDSDVDSSSDVESKLEKNKTLAHEVPYSNRACATLFSTQENEDLLASYALEAEITANSLQNDAMSLNSSIFGSSMSEDNWTNETDEGENDKGENDDEYYSTDFNDDEAVIDDDPSGDYVCDEKLLDYVSGYDEDMDYGGVDIEVSSKKVKPASIKSETKSQKLRKNSFKCNAKGCGRDFTTLVGLHLHQRVHPGKPSTCNKPGCNMKFECPNDLTKHKMKNHPEDKPHICNVNECGKRFARFSDLRKHQNIHTREKLKCTSRGCNKTFSRLDNLKKHLEVHSKCKRFKCQFFKCNKGFDCRGDLVRHSRSHTGIKPFYCTWENCKIKFTRAEHLRRHQKIHTGEEQFKCTEPGCTANYRIFVHVT
ncbi:zinc finger protein 143-like isoform X1 [Rhizophagus clarus]|uniref:Zinc finger protein 143-like isoform X1 n=1 Tax=Rhizophagus clarus TaxID=94130 RepID=A0A8H3KYC4_9GLOM|nr:zinc finger protein 143-like isoform X1 [Rhizophagus clarus]